MRGDSLRDFYAKTLALCGLALLGGVGALVDYWPVSGAVPEVVLTAAIEQPESASSLPVRDITVPVVFADAVVDTAPVYSLASLTVTHRVPVWTSRPVSLAPPPMPPQVAIVVAEDVPAAQLALTVPEPLVMPTLDPTPIYQLARQEEDAGFFAGALGAFKMTGNSIARGGAKTGTTIVDASVGAFRVMSGAFRKLKFF